MGKTERRLPRERARSGREPLRQRGHASTGLSTARIARCAVLVRTVVGAISVRSAVGHQSASTVVYALHARSAVGHQSASTVVSAIGARTVAGVHTASTVVSAVSARSARSSERIINQITTSQSVLVPSPFTRPRPPPFLRLRFFVARAIRISDE